MANTTNVAALEQRVEQLLRANELEREARELAEKRAAEAEGKLQRQGLSLLTSPIPALVRGGVRYSSVHADATHGLPSRIVQRSFGTLRSLTYTDVPSEIYNKKLRYSAEFTMYPHVETFFDDVAKLSGIAEQVYIDTPVTLSSFEADLGILRSRLTNRILSVIEVKRPVVNIDPVDSTGQRPFGQLLNYMLLLRAHYSVRHVFGLLTTWDQYYVCWLPDTDDAAASDQLLYDERTVENENPNPAVHATDRPVPDNLRVGEVHDRVMYRSRCYKREEGRPLIEMLASFMKKAIESPLAPMSMFNPARMYPLLMSSKHEMEWIKNLDLKPEDVSYKYPDAAFFEQPEVGFYLMQGYGGGRDGRVWCASTVPTDQIKQRHMVVLKVPKGDNSIEQECENWNRCYAAAFGGRIAHTVRLCGRLTLVLPFVFTGIRLSGPDRFVADRRLEEGDGPQLKEHTAVVRALRAKTADAMQRMNAALTMLQSFGVLHNDVQWRHVAELPLFREGRDEPELLSILIDLSDATVVADRAALGEQVREQRQAMQVELNNRMARHESSSEEHNRRVAEKDCAMRAKTQVKYDRRSASSEDSSSSSGARTSSPGTLATQRLSARASPPPVTGAIVTTEAQGAGASESARRTRLKRRRGELEEVEEEERARRAPSSSSSSSSRDVRMD